jgi:hypothetical protein
MNGKAFVERRENLASAQFNDIFRVCQPFKDMVGWAGNLRDNFWRQARLIGPIR